MKNLKVSAALNAALDRALSVPQQTIRDHVGDPCESAEDRRNRVRALERTYLSTTMAMGAAVGGVAAAPAVGLPAALAAAVAETGTFLYVSTMFTLSVAQAHGVELDDHRRRALVLSVLLGDAGVEAAAKAAGRAGPYWGGKVVAKVPLAAIRRVNAVLGRNFVTKYGTKQGVLVLGKTIPFGIGMAIGAAGNGVSAGLIIKTTRRLFPFDAEPETGPDARQTHYGPQQKPADVRLVLVPAA